MDEPSFNQLRSLQQDRACFMLNMLKFREWAAYQPGAPEYRERLTGRQAH